MSDSNRRSRSPSGSEDRDAKIEAEEVKSGDKEAVEQQEEPQGEDNSSKYNEDEDKENNSPRRKKKEKGQIWCNHNK